ncbi:hypothetical protein F0562_000458 [Nyssa sinensis]|uniref:C2H2-type domain-containing protein n=1 Tax=Nyssa sinensis TaxID=561372 RepID=A0A5J5C1Q6_9ASTE|nr:hypothetical protein F0562_000458 [Nyssa sinensis]
MKDNNKAKESLDSTSESHGGRDLLGGFLWHPRTYTCSFCKKEFRSAQALGGHMNVHRRDRARLRQSPPRDGQYHFLNLNLNHNPNPSPNSNINFSSPSPSSSLSTRFPPVTSTLHPLVISPSLSSLSSPSLASPMKTKKWGMDSAPNASLSKRDEDLTKMKTSKALFNVGEFKGLTQEGGCKILKKAELVSAERLILYPCIPSKKLSKVFEKHRLMETARQGNSETSSDENDRPEKVNDENTSTGRSYDCTFCKRGFTNAQALGGHMNIHRKDKAKAKQPTESSLSNKPYEDYKIAQYFSRIANEQAQYYAALGQQMNYQTLFPASNPNFPHAYNQSDLHAPGSRNLMNMHEEGMGASLSLQIGGSPQMEDGREKKKGGNGGTKGNELDLELRLGLDP